jgi:hypothetical protein
MLKREIILSRLADTLKNVPNSTFFRNRVSPAKSDRTIILMDGSETVRTPAVDGRGNSRNAPEIRVISCMIVAAISASEDDAGTVLNDFVEEIFKEIHSDIVLKSYLADPLKLGELETTFFKDKTAGGLAEISLDLPYLFQWPTI